MTNKFLLRETPTTGLRPLELPLPEIPFVVQVHNSHQQMYPEYTIWRTQTISASNNQLKDKEMGVLAEVEDETEFILEEHLLWKIKMHKMLVANLVIGEEGDGVRERSNKMCRFRPILQIWRAGRILRSIGVDSTETPTTTKMIMSMGRTRMLLREISVDADEILKDRQAGILLRTWNI